MTSIKHRNYDSKSTAYEVLKNVDLKGKTILITECMCNVGAKTARTLALRGANLVMANLNIYKSQNLRDSIYNESEKHGEIDIIQMNLTSLASVKTAAKKFIAKQIPLDVLILNGGIFGENPRTTKDGFEMYFGQQLGHFYLTYLLLDKLRESATSRLVIVSSDLHSKTRLKTSLSTREKIEKLVPNPEKRLCPLRMFAYSKLCNVLMAKKLHNDEYINGIHTYVVNPGVLVERNFYPQMGVIGKISFGIMNYRTKNLQQGASTICYCAASPDTQNDSGKYYENCWDDEKNLCKNLANDRALQDAYWTKSIELIQKFEQMN